MKTKILLPVLLYIFNVCNTQAQNIFPSTGNAGIGTTTPLASAALEIKSTSEGLLIPRMTKAQRDAVLVSTAAKGLLIYQTDNTPGFYYYSGTAWTAVTQKAKGWSLTGNAGTTPGTNFIGTTDAESLVFRVNNLRSGFIGYGTSNTSFGYQALISNTSGNYNTATGTDALLTNSTGNSNSAYGSYALLSNTTGISNVATGSDALHNNTSGNYNTATGAATLYTNTTGYNNTANGYSALYSNTTGYSNVAIGHYALFNNTIQTDDIAIGDSALYNNGHGAVNSIDATDNTAVGSKALYTNATGYQNVAIGTYTLYSDTTGSGNTGEGLEALLENTTGSLNTSIGYLSGNANKTGNYNTYLGASAGSNGDYDNSTALGHSANVNASNQVRIGDNTVTSIGGYVNWSNISDGRVKKNIKENVPGLVFINKRQPITYNLDLDAADKIIQKQRIKDENGKAVQPPLAELDSRKAKEQIAYTGFIAQEVEKAARSLNYDFSGVDAAKNDKDLYGLRYADFVAPLVKAVQELSKMNDDKDSVIQQQNIKINDLQNQINELKTMIVSSSSSTIISSASLQQNIPNPFTHTTNIDYSLPQKFTSSQIVITDKNGSAIKAINISGSGKGNVNVDASTLASGAYQYSLIVDGRLIDTKQMILAK
jgi:hypothetical protein